jgi:molybdopterin synthase catalytic subunit
MSVCDKVVETVKAELPIWKQQFEADGSYRWSGL